MGFHATAELFLIKSTPPQLQPFLIQQVRHFGEWRRSDYITVPTLSIPTADAHRVCAVESNHRPAAGADELGG